VKQYLFVYICVCVSLSLCLSDLKTHRNVARYIIQAEVPAQAKPAQTESDSE